MTGPFTCLETLGRTAALLGLRATAVRVAPVMLGQIHGPAVTHLRDGHYVTLFETGPDGVIVGDPASGIESWPLRPFLGAWSGHLLLVSRERGA